MQLLAKFERILYMGFRATLNFRKFNGGSEPHVHNFFNFAKNASHSAYQNSIIRRSFTLPSLKYKRLKLKLRVFLAGLSVALVTYCVTKIIPTCSPMIGQCFGTIIVASTDKEW